MNLENYIGKWGSVSISKEGVHESDRSNFEDYPFKTQWHKCIGVADQYLIIKFSCLTLRILESNFRIIDPPDFLPFEKVKYISSKGKLEIGVVVAYGSKWNPKPHKVYSLEVKGKVKSTLYNKERLSIIDLGTEDYKLRERLSKSVSQILRHEPEEYNIELDQSGWIDMQKLIQALKKKEQEWRSLQYYDILRMIDLSDKKRHQVKAERIGPEYKNRYNWFIRVMYGHSIMGRIYSERIEPPTYLYHGTTDKAIERISDEGLKPMRRQFVHFATNVDEAVRVGERRQNSPRIIRIDARKAFNNGVDFYKGNDNIWLSDQIPPKYLEEVPANC
jgi:putative RNA 2'-phosphotransferase